MNLYDEGYRPIRGHTYGHHYCLGCGRAFTSPECVTRLAHWCADRVRMTCRAAGELRPETQPTKPRRRIARRRRKQ